MLIDYAVMREQARACNRSPLISRALSAVDLPEANDLAVGIMALVAQQEREAISRRTKEALSVARERGVRLGNPNGIAALVRAGKGTAPLRAAIAVNAERHARDLAPVVAVTDRLMGTAGVSSTGAGSSMASAASGAISLREIAGELNDRGMLTRRGGRRRAGRGAFATRSSVIRHCRPRHAGP